MTHEQALIEALTMLRGRYATLLERSIEGEGGKEQDPAWVNAGQVLARAAGREQHKDTQDDIDRVINRLKEIQARSRSKGGT